MAVVNPALHEPRNALRTELQSIEPRQRNCIIYRPWYSPYSYFMRMDKDNQVEPSSFPSIFTVNRRDIPGEASQAVGTPESVSSSSGSLDKAHRQGRSCRSGNSAPKAKDSITSQDILLASKWQPLQQNGYKCMSCCRMFPTLHSLKTHIKYGSKEGFSCKVYYQKLKALWEKERMCQLSKIPAGSGIHSGKKHQ